MMNGAYAKNRFSRIENDLQNMTAREIRELGMSLMRLADCQEQNWKGPKPTSMIRWPSALSRIEKNGPSLAFHAKVLRDQRLERCEYLPSFLFGEISWDLLLELFMQYVGGALSSVESLAAASKSQQREVLSILIAMKEHGLVEFPISKESGSERFATLSSKGAVAMGLILEKWAF